MFVWVLSWRRVSYKTQLGINRRAALRRVSGKASMQFVLHTSTLNLFILLSCSWGMSCSNGCTTDDWETQTHTCDEHKGFLALGITTVSYLFVFVFIHYTCSRQKRTRRCYLRHPLWAFQRTEKNKPRDGIKFDIARC